MLTWGLSEYAIARTIFFGGGGGAFQSFRWSRWVASQNSFIEIWIGWRNAHKPHYWTRELNLRRAYTHSRQRSLESICVTVSFIEKPNHQTLRLLFRVWFTPTLQRKVLTVIFSKCGWVSLSGVKEGWQCPWKNRQRLNFTKKKTHTHTHKSWQAKDWMSNFSLTLLCFAWKLWFAWLSEVWNNRHEEKRE